MCMNWVFMRHTLRLLIIFTKDTMADTEFPFDCLNLKKTLNENQKYQQKKKSSNDFWHSLASVILHFFGRMNHKIVTICMSFIALRFTNRMPRTHSISNYKSFRILCFTNFVLISKPNISSALVSVVLDWA